MPNDTPLAPVGDGKSRKNDKRLTKSHVVLAEAGAQEPDVRKKCPLVQVCIPECVCVSFLILADASSIEPFFKNYNSHPDS